MWPIGEEEDFNILCTDQMRKRENRKRRREREIKTEKKQKENKFHQKISIIEICLFDA